MKIVVTGGQGKLGRAVVDALLRSRHDVVVFDRTSRDGVDGAHHVTGDIEDLGQVYGALARTEAVIHLAGIPSHSIVANELTFRINAMGTFNVHEAAWQLGIRRVITMSSEAVLGWAPGAYTRMFLPEYLPIDEDHPCRAQDCYGLSKITCEAIARSYAEKSDMELVVLRPPWIVSPEELQSLANSDGLKPDNFRLYHYVDARDVAEACRLAVERPLSGCTILFVGSGETTLSEPLADLYPRLVPEIGEKAHVLTGVLAPVSIARAQRTLGWMPRYSWRRIDAEDQHRAAE